MGFPNWAPRALRGILSLRGTRWATALFPLKAPREGGASSPCARCPRRALRNLCLRSVSLHRLAPRGLCPWSSLRGLLSEAPSGTWIPWKLQQTRQSRHCGVCRLQSGALGRREAVGPGQSLTRTPSQPSIHSHVLYDAARSSCLGSLGKRTLSGYPATSFDHGCFPVIIPES